MTSRTYAEAAGSTPHRSFFRERLRRRARSSSEARGPDPVHEYLIDQANLRGHLGAASARADLGAIDPELTIEELVVGLLQPHAPAEARVVKLVVRILQSGAVDLDRLLFFSKRERALSNLAWVLALVPPSERNEPLSALADRLGANPPRERRRPHVRFAPERLLKRPARL